MEIQIRWPIVSWYWSHQEKYSAVKHEWNVFTLRENNRLKSALIACVGFPWLAAVTYYHKLVGCRQIFSFPAIEATSPKSWSPQGQFLLRTLGKNAFQAFLQPVGLLQTLGLLVSEAHSWNLHLCLHRASLWSSPLCLKPPAPFAPGNTCHRI